MTPEELDQAVDALYAGPLDEFVAGRDALAKQLRADKQRAEADQVKALRKPNVLAYALNQLARNHADELEELLDAGESLREAQRESMRGEGATALRRATVRRENAVRGLLELMGDVDTGAALQTLRAASTDPALGEQLRTARLERELEPSDPFAMLDVGEAPVRSKPKAEPSQDTEPSDDTDREEREREERERREELERREKAEREERERREEAERKVRQQRVERAERELEKAQARVDKLQEQLDEANASLRQARAELEEALN